MRSEFRRKWERGHTIWLLGFERCGVACIGVHELGIFEEGLGA
jgi:hypothetical protein